MYTEELIIEAPVIRDRIFKKPMLCGPGPLDIWPSVDKAYSNPVITPICDEYFNVIIDIRSGIQYLFQTSSKLVLAMSGPGHAGMEALIANLLEPGETLLLASRGLWEERALMIAKPYGIKTVVTKVPADSTFSLEQLKESLKEFRPQALFITHGDSSTGTVQNLKGLGDLCHKYGTLLLVDAVAALVGEPFFMDKWGVDGVYAGTQKALSGPAGISPIAFSTLAEQKINSRKSLPPPFYFDFKLLAHQWACYDNKSVYHHTMRPPLLWALRACIKQVCNETLEKSWARHAKASAHFHKRLQEYSFQFFVPKPEDRLTTVTTVVLPEGIHDIEFIKFMRDKHNILIFPGFGPTVGKVLRIGMMGMNARIEVADAVAEAMADTLMSLKKSSPTNTPN